MNRTTLLASLVLAAIFATTSPAMAGRDPGPGPGPARGVGMAMYDYRPKPPAPQRVDQAGLNNQYADGMNLYQYVRSNPVRHLDPSGRIVIGFKGYEKYLPKFPSNNIKTLVKQTRQLGFVFGYDKVDVAKAVVKKYSEMERPYRERNCKPESVYIAGYSLGARAALVLANDLVSDKNHGKYFKVEGLLLYDYNWGAIAFDPSVGWTERVSNPIYGGRYRNHRLPDGVVVTHVVSGGFYSTFRRSNRHSNYIVYPDHEAVTMRQHTAEIQAVNPKGESWLLQTWYAAKDPQAYANTSGIVNQVELFRNRPGLMTLQTDHDGVGKDTNVANWFAAMWDMDKLRRDGFYLQSYYKSDLYR
jgi:hypothetical protein